MTPREAQSIFAYNVAKLIFRAYELGYEITLGEAWRPQEMALIYSGLYKLVHRDTGDEVPLLRRGSVKSAHREKLAIDLNLFKDGHYLTETKNHEALGKYWKSLHPNNVWGGDFSSIKDGNHYEMGLRRA